MNNKTIFLDKVFWSRLYPPLMGCISQSITTSISLIVIWWLSGSVTIVFEEGGIRRIIVLSIIMNVLVNGGILLLEFLYILKISNLFLVPIDSTLTFSKLKEYVKEKQEGGFYVTYGLPFVLLFLNAITFLVPYLLGERWISALINSTVAILPFHIAGLTIHIIKILLEIIFLILRYIIQNCR